MKKLLMIMGLTFIAASVYALTVAVQTTEYGEPVVNLENWSTPFPTNGGFVFPVQDYFKALPSWQMLITNGVLREKTTDEKAAYLAAKAAAAAAVKEALILEKWDQGNWPVELKAFFQSVTGKIFTVAQGTNLWSGVKTNIAVTIRGQ